MELTAPGGAPRVGDRGVLLLLAFFQPIAGVDPQTHGSVAFDHAYLAMADAPPHAGCSSFQLDDVELGDYVVAALPELPAEPGLWLLTWPWSIVEHPDDDDDITAEYDETGVWSRPTLAQLVALGALPPAVATVAA